MNKAALYHKMGALDAYMLDEERVLIKLRGEKGDIQTASLIYTEKYDFPFELSKMKEVPMKKVATDSVFDYFEGIATIDMIAMKYCFRLIDTKHQELYYGLNAFEIEQIVDYRKMFDLPQLAKVEDRFLVPSWMKESIVYQIFPERFSPDQLPEKNSSWYGPVKSDTLLGGTLKGIRRQLDYIESLGVNTLYLTPIFTSPSNHKYNTTDYYEIDPAFGTKEDFKELVDELHARNMRIILDGVFNHSGDTFMPFEDVMTKGEESAYKEWFDIKCFPVHPGDYKTNTPPNYRAFAFYHRMPKINTMSEEATAYILDAVAYWTKEFEIDGWRLDVADEVSHGFWKRFRRVVREINPEAAIIGEVWYDSSEWLRGDEFDSVMNYKFADPVKAFIAEESLTPSEFFEKVSEPRGLYPIMAYDVMWNLLDSHDTPRFLHHCVEDKNKLKLATLLQMTWTGVPYIYYGDELGMTGAHDPDCRRGMLWDEDLQDKALLEYFKQLITLRKNHPVFVEGELNTMIIDDKHQIFAYERVNNYEKMIVVLNNSGKNKKIKLQDLGLHQHMTYTDMVTGEIFDGHLSAKSGVVLLVI